MPSRYGLLSAIQFAGNRRVRGPFFGASSGHRRQRLRRLQHRPPAAGARRGRARARHLEGRRAEPRHRVRESRHQRPRGRRPRHAGRRLRPPQRGAGAAGQGRPALLDRQCRRHAHRARGRALSRRKNVLPHVVERGVRHADRDADHRQDPAAADRDLRPRQARRRGAGEAGRPRGHAGQRRAAAHHRRPRPPRHLRDPVRLDPRRRQHLHHRPRHLSLPVRPGRRPRRGQHPERAAGAAGPVQRRHRPFRQPAPGSRRPDRPCRLAIAHQEPAGVAGHRLAHRARQAAPVAARALALQDLSQALLLRRPADQGRARLDAEVRQRRHPDQRLRLVRALAAPSATAAGGSFHKQPVKQGILRLLKKMS